MKEYQVAIAFDPDRMTEEEVFKMAGVAVLRRLDQLGRLKRYWREGSLEIEHPWLEERPESPTALAYRVEL